MKNFNKNSLILLLTMVYSQGFGPIKGNPIPITSPTLITEAIHHPPHFTINHGFSLMANSSTFGATTSGVYSNQMQYNFSDKLNLNSTLHFINSNQSLYSNNQNVNVKYKLGLEYKLYENTQIFFQFSNIRQQQNNMPYMFKPGL